jgi:hypothetical protein
VIPKIRIDLVNDQYQDHFFSRVRTYFDKKYSGRYFSVILAELARSEPRTFAAIVEGAGIKLSGQFLKSLNAGELTIALEWRFPDTRRRADLAVYSDPAHPILLIEVKDEDGKKSNAGQLKDYIWPAPGLVDTRLS